MKKLAYTVFVLVLLSVLFTGCTSGPTNVPAHTDTPAATLTAIPPNTPTATATPMPLFIPEADGPVNTLTLERNFFGGVTQSWFKVDGAVLALALQWDGKIVVGGDFATLGGETRNSIAVLNPDGTLEDALSLP